MELRSEFKEPSRVVLKFTGGMGDCGCDRVKSFKTETDEPSPRVRGKLAWE